MIEFMIKRDGTRQPFDANKANHLMEFAEARMPGRCNMGATLSKVVRESAFEVTSSDFNNALIRELIEQKSWPAMLMAGRIYAFETRKQLYGKTMPTLFQLHREMIEGKRLVEMGYLPGEYAELEKIIDHDLDFTYPQFALKQLRDKYALKNVYTGKEFETPQFTYMRMAMALCVDDPVAVRVQNVKDFYWAFSTRKLSAPTPNYTNLGTSLRGYASCCLFSTGDTNESIRAGMLIAADMTANSAGLGWTNELRSAGDPVRSGAFVHRGKKPYMDTMGKITKQNVKNGRDGAMTAYYNAFDPEASMIAQFHSPLTPVDMQNRDIHFAMVLNRFFVHKAGLNEDIMMFNKFTAPDLYEAMFSPDLNKFIELYNKYENDPNFEKKYVSARTVLAHSYSDAFDTGTAYQAFADELNRHTPFKDPIYQSNLCLEVAEPTKPYRSVADMYDATDHGHGEIAMCNLAARAVNNCDIDNDEEMLKVSYLALKMIDKTIHLGEYPYPHLEFTTKQRMNAGVGMMGLATLMARRGLKYSSTEGKKFLHYVFERHMYFLIKASIKISKERGLAPWIHKTKWPEGWTPLDTYNKGVDEIADFENTCDWAALKQELIDNGGIAHSTLCNFMPGESSSKALGASNSIYRVRGLSLMKRDGSNKIDWLAEDGDLLGDNYEFAFDASIEDQIDTYGIAQKWCDQAPSADLYWKFSEGAAVVPFERILEITAYMCKRGMKTRYYMNSRRPAPKKTDEFVQAAAVSQQQAQAAPAMFLDHSLLGNLTGIEVQHEEQEWVDLQIADNCEGMCKL